MVGDVIGTLADAAGAALRARTDALQRAALVDHDGLDDDIAFFEFLRLLGILGFPVGDGALEERLETDGGLLLGEVEEVEGVIHLDTPDGVSDEAHLPRGGGSIFQYGDGGLLLGFFQALGHQMFSLTHSTISFYFLLLPAWPLKFRVGANSPSLWPTMFSVT